MEKWQQERLERLRREDRRERGDQPVLHAPRPEPPKWEPAKKEDAQERGVVIIDFTI